MSGQAAKDDRFADYFKSSLHLSRLNDAQKRTAERLAGIGREDLLAACSEAIGMAFGIGQFYRVLGLKHQAAQVFNDVFKWLKKGTD